ncbi:MAG: Permuted papain-like amidase enzyme YaeF/YiiX, family [Bacillales bacterium]|jgi:uncharacterized protein YycO|nr:Permuted papain-like amidase enzyme YaeF/YiiX, family [Bacillales bacterium]
MPKQGDIVFFKSNGNLLGRLISFFSRAKYEIVHVAIYVERDITIETNLSKRVNYATISEYKAECVIKSYKDITDEQREIILEYCKNRFGEPYDLVQIFELFLEYFGIDFPYKERKMKICSTLVWNAYDHAGIKLTLDEDCTPDELFNNKNLE